MSPSMEAAFPTFAGFLLVLMRCGALCAVAPLFGTKSVPPRLRLALAVAVSTAVFSAGGMPRFPGWSDTGSLAMAALTETAIGLSAGLAARFAIEAAAAAGHAIGLSMGLGFGAVIDPVHGSDSTAIAELLTMVALAVAVAAGVHRDAVAWLCRSVQASPPGSVVALRDLASTVVSEAVRSTALSVRLAYPVMAAVTFGHLGLGLVGRVAPQLNLSNIGFSVAILAGGAALYLVAPEAAEIAAQAARAAFTKV
jgi:flagellar biosynthetic protein FliR